MTKWKKKKDKGTRKEGKKNVKSTENREIGRSRGKETSTTKANFTRVGSSGSFIASVLTFFRRWDLSWTCHGFTGRTKLSIFLSRFSLEGGDGAEVKSH